MKLRLLAAATAVLALGSGAALAQAAPAAPAAAAPAAAVPADRSTLGYSLGYEWAKDLADHKVDIDMAALQRGFNDGYGKKPPTIADDKRAATLTAFQKRMYDEEKAAFERVARENKTRSDAFMAANKAKPGVTTLPSGVQYRVIEAGTGPKPTDASTVQLHLRGSITTGQEFFNTYSTANAQPTTLKVSDLPMAGMKEIVKMMPVGSRWEVYIPSDKAYGNDPRAMIGPGQAVVFDVKLVSSK
jgi:peptidylprolyl isomerase